MFHNRNISTLNGSSAAPVTEMSIICQKLDTICMCAQAAACGQPYHSLIWLDDVCYSKIHSAVCQPTPGKNYQSIRNLQAARTPYAAC